MSENKLQMKMGLWVSKKAIRVDVFGKEIVSNLSPFVIFVLVDL